MNAAARIPALGIDAAILDRHLLGAGLGDPDTWAVWLTILRAAFGIALRPEELPVFAELAGGRAPPPAPVRELWAIAGRRAGKSRIAAAVAVYVAAIHPPKGKLAAGETGVVMVLAASKAQAGVIMSYVKGYFDASPILSTRLEDATADEIRLRGNVCIAVHSNNSRTVRGRTLLACIFDEVAHWRDESTSNPDIETYRAVRPALATTSGMLVGISSPHAMRGLLHERHRDYFGRDDPGVLVVRSPTLRLNPTLDVQVVLDARADDPEGARSEWDAEFRGDLVSFVSRQIVEYCIEPGVRERPPNRQFRYTGFVDPSGGARDSFVLAIAHLEGEPGAYATPILDLIREIPAPFNPEAATAELAEVCKSYRVPTVYGDNYAAEWPKDAFSRNGIYYSKSEKVRSDLYLNLLPLLMSRAVDLLDSPRLVAQLSGLERSPASGGRDRVDHSRFGSDDVANAVAGVLWHVRSAPSASRFAQRRPLREGERAMDKWDPFAAF